MELLIRGGRSFFPILLPLKNMQLYIIFIKDIFDSRACAMPSFCCNKIINIKDAEFYVKMFQTYFEEKYFSNGKKQKKVI